MSRIRFGRDPMGNLTWKAGEPLSLAAKAYSKPRNTVAPTFTGTAGEGNLQTRVPGTWVNATVITWEWQANGTTVQVLGATYIVQASDVGKTITLLERATNASGLAAAARSPGVLIP